MRQPTESAVHFAPSNPRPAISWAAALAVVVSLVTFVLYLTWLTSFDEPFGRDGYYYTLQILHLKRSGLPRYPTPFVFPLWWLTALATVCSDPVLGVKLAAAIACGILTYLVYATVATATDDPQWGLVGAVLVATAGRQRYFAAEYVSNLVGMVAFAAFLALLVRCATRRVASTQMWAAAVLCGLIALFCHGSSAAAVALIVLIIGVSPLVRRSLWGRMGSVVAALVVLCILLVILGAERTSSIKPSALSWSFLDHFSSEYSIIVVITSIIVLRMSWRRQCAEQSAGLKAVFLATLMLALMWCANPLWRYHQSPSEVSDRLALWGWYLCSILVPVTVKNACASGGVVRLVAALTLLLTLFAGLDHRRPSGATNEYLRERKDLVEALKGLGSLPIGGVVVAERGLQFAVEQTTGSTAVSAIRAVHDTQANAVYWLIRLRARRDVKPPPYSIEAPPWVFVRHDQLLSWMESLPAPEAVEVRIDNPLIREQVMTASAKVVRRNVATGEPDPR